MLPPEWLGPNGIAAIGQAAGAVATAAAVIVALWLGIRDRRWRTADQHDQRAAQARLITVGTSHIGDEYTSDTTFLVTVTNDSEALIRGITLTGLGHEGHRPRYVHDVHSEPAEYYLHTPNVLRPGEIWRQPVYFTGAKKEPIHRSGPIETTVEFVDAAGLRWRRVDANEPTRVIEGTKPRLRFRKPWYRE